MNYNQAVITTKYILDGSPILEVIRDEDGDWQFLGGQEIIESDAIVLSLQQVIDLDNTVNEVLNLDISSSAYRKTKNHKWKYMKLD